MRGAERIVFAFGPFGEAGQAAALAQRVDAVAPPGQDLVRVALVSDVPDQAVVRRFECIMQRHRELDHAEAGAEMSAGLGDRVDQVFSQFIRDLPQPVGLEAPQFLGSVDLIEKWGFGWLIQRLPPCRPAKAEFCGTFERICKCSISMSGSPVAAIKTHPRPKTIHLRFQPFSPGASILLATAPQHRPSPQETMLSSFADFAIHKERASLGSCCKGATAGSNRQP